MSVKFNFFLGLCLNSGLLLSGILSVPVQAQSVDEIIVLSNPTARQSEDIISTIHIVDDTALNGARGGPIGSAIADLPGVDVASHGPAVGRPVIRGLGGYRIGVLEDGMVGGDVSQTGNDHANAALLYTTARLEVVKGPAALRYGAYGHSGVVNAFSRHDVVNSDVESRLLVGGGDGANEAYAAFFTRQALGAGSWTLSAFGQSRDDMTIPTYAESRQQLLAEGEEAEKTGEQTADNTDVEADGVTAGLVVPLAGGTLRFIADRQNNAYGIASHTPHADADNDEVDEGHEEAADVRAEIERQKFNATLKLPLTGLFRQMHLQIGVVDFAMNEFEGSEIGTSFDRSLTSMRIELTPQAETAWQGLWGLSYEASDLSTDGAEAFLPDTQEANMGLFAVYSGESEAYLMEVALRYDSATREKAMIERNFDLLNMAVGLGYKPDESSLIGLSLTAGQRAPAVTELFADGRHTAANREETGDDTLGIEKISAGEIYLRQGFERASVQLSVFRNDYTDFIDLILIDAASAQYQYRQGGAAIDGIELTLATRGDIGSGTWSLSGAYAQLRGEDANGKPLRAIPTDKLTVEGRVKFADWHIGTMLIHAEAQNELADAELATDGYDKWDIEFGWRPFARSNMQLTLAVENLTNEEIRHHTSALKDLLPEAGRDVRFSLDATF